MGKMLLKLKQINVPSGQHVLITDLNWQEFEAVLENLGEKRSSRIAYDRGTLEIMTPLPEHEINKIFISNFIEILLEELDIEFCPLGSTTFQNKLMNLVSIKELFVQFKELLSLTIIACNSFETTITAILTYWRVLKII